MSTLLDTNILIRLIQPDHPQHIPTRDAITIMLERREELYIVPQNLYEFWGVATRPANQNGFGMSAKETQSEITQIKRLFTLLRDERGIFTEWERLVVVHDVKGKNTHDVRLVAAMQRHNLTRLLTFNTEDFKRFTDIQVITPADVLSSNR